MLTLSQMAAELKITAKTFSKDVKAKRIPFTWAGKRKRFNPEIVKAHLAATDDEPCKPERQKSNRIPQVTKYSGLLGW